MPISPSPVVTAGLAPRARITAEFVVRQADLTGQRLDGKHQTDKGGYHPESAKRK